MTEVIDQSLADHYQEQIRSAAQDSRIYLYSPSVLRAAAAALQDVQAALDEHGIGAPFERPLGPLAARILAACTERFDSAHYYTESDPDPVQLLDTAAGFAADHFDQPLQPLDGPALADSRAQVAYMVLPRLPETPAWGDDGQAPLVVTLGRPDRAAMQLIYSSGGGPLRDYEPGPWSWHLGHQIPGDIYIGSGTRIIASEPSHESAAEVGGLIADVLTGQIVLPD